MLAITSAFTECWHELERPQKKYKQNCKQSNGLKNVKEKQSIGPAKRKLILQIFWNNRLNMLTLQMNPIGKPLLELGIHCPEVLEEKGLF